MTVTNIFRADATNVGDWYCAPNRYFPLSGRQCDILDLRPGSLEGSVIVGGGGLMGETFRVFMQEIAKARPRMDALIAWGIGENFNVDRGGGIVLPYTQPLPDYLSAFDLVGVRDFGTNYRWAPCASCMLPYFDDSRASAEHEIVIYEHKRIRIPIDGFPRKTNDGNDIDGALNFLSSGEVVITNSYHGAYWATLLGRRVLAIPNLSKMYRFKHAPVISRAQHWKRLIELTVPYPDALVECRAATRAFYEEVKKTLAAQGGTERSDLR
jgi:hypothetical protein